MTVLYNDVNSAILALKKEISGLDWNSKADQLKIRKAIHQVVQATSVAAEGETTVFYSGYINITGSFKIAATMKEDSRIRIIDKTAAFQLLNDDDFKNIQAKAFGYETYGEMEKALAKEVGTSIKVPVAEWTDAQKTKYYSTPEKVFEGHGEKGLGAQISKRFAAETEGDVVIMTELPNVDSVLVLTELKETIEKNDKITRMNSVSMETLRSVENPVGSIIALSAALAVAGEL